MPPKNGFAHDIQRSPNPSYHLGMEDLTNWKLCNELTVVEAALLILGMDPTPHLSDVVHQQPGNQPVGYTAVFNALKYDIESGRLKAQIVKPGSYASGHPLATDWSLTRVAVQDLKDWLQEGNRRPEFFFSEETDTADYLNRGNPQFSPRLAAAVKAWQAIRAERERRTPGRSVKTDLTKWLMKHATELELVNDEGRPLTGAIEDVASVANWDQKGGAPKTPGK